MKALIALPLLGALAFLPVPAVTAVPPCNSLAEFLDCVTAPAVYDHMSAFQTIADANGDNRASGTSGYDQSADYVAGLMSAAGYDVTVQAFMYSAFFVLSPTALEEISPVAMVFPNNILSFSGSGDVTAAVTHLPAAPADPSPGCDAADFAGFTPGHIALIERGGCTFAVKAVNASAAGATGVIFYNDEAGDINATLGADFTPDLPVTGVTQSIGQQLAAEVGLIMRLKTETDRGPFTTANVLAETPGGDPEKVIMVGAHLDSVRGSPGIQDNGSGSAAILEVALQLAKVQVTNKVRFAWWGAEEVGLQGSKYYLDNLSPEALSKIALYLDFHMIASPNYVFFILDGDDSDGVGFPAGPPGSAAIEALFESFYTGRGLPFTGEDLTARSDYFFFGSAGIPIGGIFAGAEVVKSAPEAALWGGVAGEQYDPCFHLACDTLANHSMVALDTNSDAAAYAIYKLAEVIREVPTVTALPIAGLALLASLLVLAGGFAAHRRVVPQKH
ncbi:MAG: M28 family peptidase [Chromatiales bacterium]|nr:M28 family peptidase [Chromatiales bacterium]